MYHFLQESERGLAAWVGGKPVFPSIQLKLPLKAGMVEVWNVKWTKEGRYGFASMRNRGTVIPSTYGTLPFFRRRGLPIKVDKGVVGDTVILREKRKTNTSLCLYGANGEPLIMEHEYTRSGHVNLHYTRLHAAVSEWVDITPLVIDRANESLRTCVSEFDGKPDRTVFRPEYGKKRQLYAGVWVGEGRFETVAAWGTKQEVCLCWLGQRLIDGKLRVIRE